MRNKVCKKLRKEARKMTEGAPYRGLVSHETVRSTAINHPTTTLAFYRRLKAVYRKMSLQKRGVA